MIKRLFTPPTTRSFFLFGPRGSGKSTLIRDLFDLSSNQVLFLDLLDPAVEKELGHTPEKLISMVEARKSELEWIVIDEVQKIPKLLDVAHKIIFEKKIKFALTGSSARKLKRDSANLLAGRAFSFNLHPFSFLELKNEFNTDSTLAYGALPDIYNLDNDLDRKRYLLAYVQTYIKEEILVEQLIRNIDPFRSFLEVAAQANTEIINYSSIAKSAQINSKSVERYFSILHDTLLGFFLEPYSRSIRSRQKMSPKFYFFDCGVVRAISNEINQKLLPQTFAYGKLFEQMIISEFFKLNDYYEKNWKFSYIRTGAGVEIDLIIERSKNDFILVEIKSSHHFRDDYLSSLKSLGKEFKNAQYYVLCQITNPLKLEDIKVMPWMQGIKEIFEI
jgi:predicted AAA+ superfamily ATPase